MLSITDFLSCTDPLDEFESLSYHQTHHAKTYVTGLAAASSKTVTGIAREVLPAQSSRTLNKFLTQYDWDEKEMAPRVNARSSAYPHKTQHKQVSQTMEILDFVLAVVGILVVLALLDGQTGVSALDHLIRAVPVDWVRGVVEV